MGHLIALCSFSPCVCFFTLTQEIRQINQEEFLRDRQEDEMEMSDNEEEGPAPKKSRKPDEPGSPPYLINHLTFN